MYPPQEIEIGLNNYCHRKKSFHVRSASTFYNLPRPPALPSFQYLTLFYAWTGNLWISISNGYLQIWISGFQITVILELDDIPPPLQSSKNEMLIFGLCSTSDNQPSDLSDEKSTEMWKEAPKVIKKWNACFWIMFNFWWLAEWSKQQK